MFSLFLAFSVMVSKKIHCWPHQMMMLDSNLIVLYLHICDVNKNSVHKPIILGTTLVIPILKFHFSFIEKVMLLCLYYYGIRKIVNVVILFHYAYTISVLEYSAYDVNVPIMRTCSVSTTRQWHIIIYPHKQHQHK